MRTIRLADYVFEVLAAKGVKSVFMVPGGGAMYLVDALGQNPDIEFVANHHEQASSVAAEANSRINENLGVALVTTGPGSTNAITGVVGAWLDSVPMLVLSGQVKRADLTGNLGVRQAGPQEVDIISMVKTVTKYAVTVMDPKDIRFHLEKALHEAMSGRKGPAWLDIPLDVQNSMITPEELRGFTAPQPEARPDLDAQIQKIVELIKKSERPLLLAGQGVRLAGGARDFQKLYERTRIPVVATWNAMDMIAADHELSAGRPGVVALRPGNFAVQNCDLLISIGSRLDNIITAYNPEKFARGAKRVVVDIDPKELAKFKMAIEVAVCADAKDFIERLSAALSPIDTGKWAVWRERCQDWKRRYPAGEGQPIAERGVISHYDFARVMSEELPEDTTIVTGSSGLAVEIFYTAFQNKKGQRIFNTTCLGPMGFGLPAMVGVGAALEGKPFVGVESDGSLQMNLQELSTIKGQKYPVCIFIMNNEGYASIRATQRNYFESRYVGTGPEGNLYFPDNVAICEAIGISAQRISDLSELRAGIRHALASAKNGPFLCEVKCKRDDILWPKSSAMPQPDGSMKSMPLEDMAPFLSREELRQNMILPLEPISENLDPALIPKK